MCFGGTKVSMNVFEGQCIFFMYLETLYLCNKDHLMSLEKVPGFGANKIFKSLGSGVVH